MCIRDRFNKGEDMAELAIVGIGVISNLGNDVDSIWPVSYTHLQIYQIMDICQQSFKK